MDFRVIGWKGVNWFYLAQAGSCDCSNGLSDSVKGREFLDWLSDY
jgi:hypothetical protein